MVAKIKIIEGDCRETLEAMRGNRQFVNTIITDPPYHLASIVKRFGKEGSAAAKHGADGRFNRSSKDFIGQSWDGVDKDGTQIAHNIGLWKACHDVLLPGGLLLAFSSPKTGHRMACAMEDAGLVMHPFIAWLYGQGFPKAHAIGPTWPGWYQGGQTLNPACEPIYVAQRPKAARTMAGNMGVYGTGAFNIDDSRVPAADPRPWDPSKTGGRGSSSGKERDLARWPSNVAHDGSDDALGAFPVDPKGASPARYFNSFPPALYHPKRTKAEKVGDHPTQKPIGLLRWLAKLTTTPGGTILDPFCGTATTLEAAYKEGFNSIGVERDPEYVKAARLRISPFRRSPEDLLG